MGEDTPADRAPEGGAPVLPYDPEEWQRRLEEARARRLEVLAARRAAAEAQAALGAAEVGAPPGVDTTPDPPVRTAATVHPVPRRGRTSPDAAAEPGPDPDLDETAEAPDGRKPPAGWRWAAGFAVGVILALPLGAMLPRDRLYRTELDPEPPVDVAQAEPAPLPDPQPIAEQPLLALAPPATLPPPATLAAPPEAWLSVSVVALREGPLPLPA